MRYTMACYFDVELEKFNPPMLFPFEKEAVIETLKEGAIKGRIEGCEAFHVYILGYFNGENGSFDLLAKPEKVLELKQFVRKAD